jgi:zinc D-Ala-D-Ala carboxypeptidase
MDWSKYPNFSKSEMACKHTGACVMDGQFMSVLQSIRNEFGPMRITSGYRHPTHPIEAKKKTPGEHTLGRCADVAVEGKDAYRLIEIAIKHGITRIGVQQKGAGRFIHLGLGGPGFPSPAVWSY